mgnify:CR=1 FL=1
MKSALLRWWKSPSGDAFVAWMHIKAIRVFVESVLRYGLPVDFTSVLYKVNIGKESQLTMALDKTLGNGADVVFDVVGGEVFDACSRAMAWGGRLLVIGFASGTIPQFPVNLALVKGYSVVGVFWGSFTAREPKVFASNMQELMSWYMNGKVKPLVEAVYPLEKAADALKFIHDRKAVGKVVLNP